MIEVLKSFLTRDIISFENYSITLLKIILIAPIIFADILITRLINMIARKKDLLKKGFSRTVIRVGKALVHIVAFLAIIKILGGKLLNIFDLIGAVLNFKLFKIGDTDVTLLTIIVVAVVIYVSTKIADLVRRYLNSNFFPRFNIEEGIRFSLSKLTGYVIIALGIIIALQSMGIKLGALTVFAGVLGVGIGFGMQNITANFVSGLAIIFERPIKEGDMIRLKDTIGIVSKISLRATVIKTIFNEHLIVPNSEFINSVVENMSYGDLKLRIKIRVGVAYGTDPYLVKEALLEAASVSPDILEHPEPVVLFKEFGDSSLNFELLAWIDEPIKRFEAESELHFAIVEQFKKRNITIPFPQRDLYIKQLPPADFQPPSEKRFE